MHIYVCGEGGITKNLGDEFETFVDSFHLGGHGRSKTNATDAFK